MGKLLLKTVSIFGILFFLTSFDNASAEEDYCKNLVVNEQGEVLVGTSPEFGPLSGAFSMGTQSYQYGCSSAYKIVLEVTQHTVLFKSVQVVFTDGTSLSPISLKGELTKGETRAAYVGGKEDMVIEEIHIQAGNIKDGSSQYKVYLRLDK
ncbi:hypothetical protein N9W41_00965 [bacterium]|nr:hypothetical protein [bacterium]